MSIPPTCATIPSTHISSNASDETVACASPTEGVTHSPEPNVLNETSASTQPVPKVDDSIYDLIPPHRKMVITFVLGVCGFLAPMSSTTVLSAIPEVASTFHTTGSMISLTNAIYLVFMGLSPCFWAPMSQVYGRRPICLATALLFFACSLGTALSPDLWTFFVFRALTAFQGTSFLVVGASCLGDIYQPTERAKAVGWFLSGTLIGPAIGPSIAGVIVTYRSWRVIFYLQAAFGGLATVLVFFLLPETIHHKRSDELVGLTRRETASRLWKWTNPLRVITLYRYPNLAAANSALVWNQYSLLTPIRYIMNPRFSLTLPAQAGLFYLAPGLGYLTGTFMGGRWADHTVKKWIEIRGIRIPEDRLRSCIPFLGVLIPGCMLVYGWSIDKRAGGIALPVILMFIQGCGQLFCNPSLNAYCLDVIPSRSAEVIAGSFMIRYFFAALASAVVLPAVEKIGVGWFSTISSAFLVVAGVGVHCTALWGQSWRDKIDGKHVEGEK
ncbi:major facilitator superfamily domain-containing protein [Mycena rebaudengoi]|nr:major facilitator superfamily domain-containing protein [Mycena rebaudengoi]